MGKGPRRGGGGGWEQARSQPPGGGYIRKEKKADTADSGGIGFNEYFQAHGIKYENHSLC